MTGILPKLILGVTLLLLASGAPIPDEPQSGTPEELPSGDNTLDSGSPSTGLLEPPESNTAEDGALGDTPSGGTSSSRSESSDNPDSFEGSPQEVPAEDQGPQTPDETPGEEPGVSSGVPTELSNEEAAVIPEEPAGAVPLPVEESLPPVPQAADGAVVPEEAPVVPAVAPSAGAPELTVPRVFPLETPSGAQPLLPGHKLVHEQKTEGSQQDSFSEAEQAAAQASGASASGNAVKNVHGYSNEGGFRKTDGFSEQSENRYGSGNFQGSEGFDQTSSGHQGSFAVKSYGVHGNPGYADALKVGFVP